VAPQLELLCESDCAQQALGSYDMCSKEPMIQAILGTQCATGHEVDADGDGDIDLDDQECTNRGADTIVVPGRLANETDLVICAYPPVATELELDLTGDAATNPSGYVGGFACPGPCTGEHAPDVCDESTDLDGDSDGTDGRTAGVCKNNAVCIDRTHNTHFLPRDITQLDPTDLDMFGNPKPRIMLPPGHVMCGCTPGFTGRFCTCTSIDNLLFSCHKSSGAEHCNNALQLMDNELARLCGLGQLSDFDDPDLTCGQGCANLFAPFYSICGDTLWPTEGPACPCGDADSPYCVGKGEPMPTDGPGAAAYVACGLDPAFNAQVATFEQKCAVAGGREDGQADYCVEKACGDCHNEDGCGWCMHKDGTGVCSNECFTSPGECAGMLNEGGTGITRGQSLPPMGIHHKIPEWIRRNNCVRS
jgi:hypothetical protein